jgi:hypothetical protein
MTVDEPQDTTTGWVGWIFFASVMMIIGGALNAFHGLVAIVNDDWVVWGNSADLYLDLTEWGWVHLIVGALVVLAGFGLLTATCWRGRSPSSSQESASSPTSSTCRPTRCGR